MATEPALPLALADARVLRKPRVMMHQGIAKAPLGPRSPTRPVTTPPETVPSSDPTLM